MARIVRPALDYVAALVAGTAGVGRTVPAGTFRSDSYRGTAEDAGTPSINRTRTFVLRPRAQRPWGAPPGYQYGSDVQQVIRADLVVYYRTDEPLPVIGAAPGSDDTSDARAVAMDDMTVIVRALVWAENQLHDVEGGTVVMIAPDGEHTLDDDTANDQVISTQPIAITLQWAPTTAPDLGSSA